MPFRPFRLVHSAGKRGIKSMTEYMSEELGLSDWKEAGFDVVDYIYDMPLLMVAADIVLCRSGASTLAELTAIGKPAILVPSPNVVNNHQEKNARVLERGGGAVVLLESDAGADVMLSTINGLLSDKEKLAEMEEHMRDLAVENEVARNMYERSELDYLIYNAPLEYNDLILNGNPETYLKTVTEYKPWDS